MLLPEFHRGQGCGTTKTSRFFRVTEEAALELKARAVFRDDSFWLFYSLDVKGAQRDVWPSYLMSPR